MPHPLPARTGRSRGGVTLIELTVVLLVVVALAGLVIPMLGSTTELAKKQVTEASLARLREAILGTESAPGYRDDMDSLPETLADLFRMPPNAPAFDPSMARGWRGPYVRFSGATYARNDDYGDPDDPAILDGWGEPIVLQRPTTESGDPDDLDLHTRLISTGPDKVLNVLDTDLTAATRGDDLVLFLLRADAPDAP